MQIKVKTALLATLACVGLQIIQPVAHAQALEPSNLGRGLQRIVGLYRSNPQAAIAELKAPQGVPAYILDKTGERPLVNVNLDGTVPIEPIVRNLQQLGFTVKTTTPFRKGIIEGFLPIAKATEIAQMPGVRSVTPVFQPYRRVGATTSQAVETQNVLPVQQAGLLGAGIKIGVLSDSYSAISNPTSAQDDIASGDLPGPGNPLGNTTPVTVIEDGVGPNNSDEGRAMLQLIHDITPKAQLGFATASGGEVSFANNILALRQQFGADVIVDDIGYLSEPIYSDGVINQAVDQVAAAGAAYFSAAGNDADNGYESTYVPVSRQEAQVLVGSGQQNLQLSRVPASVASNFHDFDPGSGTDISQSITVLGGASLSFQWDEPFGFGAVQTNYNLLVFSRTGRYLGILSGTDDNLSVDQPLEIVSLPSGRYQLVIAKANPSGSAQRVKYISFGEIDGEYVGASTIFGHPAAKGGLAVGAAFFATPTIPEDFTSLGPTTILFNESGQPLANPEIRQTPQVTGIDGVNTTFFSFDIPEDSDSFPNFFGTSAAAPNVAAVAALVLEAAGGPGTLTPQQLYTRLQSTAADIADPGVDNLTGSGLVDAERAVKAP